MSGDTILCQGCGITLRPFMNRCPRCGMARLGATQPAMPGAPTTPTDDEPVVMAPLQTVTTGALPFRTASAPAETAAPRTTIIPFDEQRRRLPLRPEAIIAPPPDTVFMSPPDTVRRFPILNPSQWMLLFSALALLLLGLVIGYLLWSRERKDTVGATLTTNAPLATTLETSLPSAVPTIDPLSASPTPELAPMVEGDQAILAEVNRALAAYNPIYHSRYQVAIKDGAVTVTGPADNQPEKDGVTNVIKLVAGVKAITNNLTVKADPTAAQGGLPMMPGAQTTAPTVTPLPENNLANQQAALEAERQRLAREAEAQRQREAEFNRQREADNQRLAAQRQREEDQRRQREEAERPRIVNPPTAAPVTAAPRVLRSGTVAWSGLVDGVDEIIFAGGSASVRHQSGEGVREARAAFSAPIPRAPVAVQLVNSNGRGSIQIVQEPSAANGYTTIVRLDDSRENGGKAYQFTLRWTAQ